MVNNNFEGDAFNCKVKVLETPPELAVSITDCAVATEEALAKKPAEVTPAGTVSAKGSDSALLLLDSFTTSPPDGAAELSVTLQESVPGPVIDALVQVRVVGAAPDESAEPVSGDSALFKVPASSGFVK